MNTLPLTINLKGKKLVIIGGGKVAERKVTTLLDLEAFIHVISPEITELLKTYANSKDISWHKKTFQPADVIDAFLIIIATDDKSVITQVLHAAPKNALINSAQDASQGNVQFPVHFKRGRLSIAIATNGASPMLAKKIKADLEKVYTEDYEAYIDFLYEARIKIKQSHLPKEKKLNILQELVTDDKYRNILVQRQWLIAFIHKLDKS